MAKQAPDREKALELAIAQIEKNHGKGSVMRLGDDVRPPISVIPTGSIALDVALGIGGLPRGRIVEIYGPESSGKTTLMLHAIAEAQRAGLVCAFIDAERLVEVERAGGDDLDVGALAGVAAQGHDGALAEALDDRVDRLADDRADLAVRVGVGGFGGGAEDSHAHRDCARRAAGVGCLFGQLGGYRGGGRPAGGTGGPRVGQGDQPV